MSDDYGDTGESSYEDSQTSGVDAEGSSQGTGDIGSDSEADAGPVPYERFKESRQQLNESRSQVDELRQQMESLQSQHNDTAQWNQWAWQQLQQQQQQSAPAVEEDVYADPLERRVNQLESKWQQQTQFYDHRHQQMQAEQAEKEILNELQDARSKYPEMRDNDVINSLVQNPNASVSALAKRSHEAELAAFNNKLKRQGLKPKPKQLHRGRNKAVIRQEIGDDMDKAEAMAIAHFSGE